MFGCVIMTIDEYVLNDKNPLGLYFHMINSKVYLGTSKVQVGGYLTNSNKYIFIPSFILIN